MEPLERHDAPKRGFWVGMGWAALITIGMVLVIAAATEVWG